ncbi:MAG: PEGA domain-containing protein [Myxococcales bacterium]|nr:PEGA domain-containing protein [Myxococcales bacterium]
MQGEWWERVARRWLALGLLGTMQVLGVHCSTARVLDRDRTTRRAPNRWRNGAPKPASDDTTRPPRVPSPTSVLVAPQKRARVYIFMLEPRNLGGPTAHDGVEIAALVTSLLRGSVNALPEVALRTYRELPTLGKRIAALGDLGHRDRVSLVALRHDLGLDGLVAVAYRMNASRLRIEIRYIDLASGRVHPPSIHTTRYSAALFDWIERATLRFAASLRRVYRATMQVQTTPSKVRVLVDGREVGVSPIVLELPQGPHRLELRKNGYRSVTKDLVLRDGQELHLESTLYSPLAHYYMRRESKTRIDSNHFTLGYRFAYLIKDPLHLEGLHLATLRYLLQFRRFAFGATVAGSALHGAQSYDSIFGTDKGSATQRGTVLQLALHLRYTIVDIFSFLSIYAAAEVGTTRYKVNDVRNWTIASGLFCGATARLVRNGNFTMEFNLEAGFVYNGEIAYAERFQNLFGSSFTRRRLAPSIGPSVGATLVFRFWNEVF